MIESEFIGDVGNNQAFHGLVKNHLRRNGFGFRVRPALQVKFPAAVLVQTVYEFQGHVEVGAGFPEQLPHQREVAVLDGAQKFEGRVLLRNGKGNPGLFGKRNPGSGLAASGNYMESSCRASGACDGRML